MTQNEIHTLTAPVTAAQLEEAPLLTTEVRSAEGQKLINAGRLNWALHNTWDGDAEGLATWINAQD